MKLRQYLILAAIPFAIVFVPLILYNLGVAFHALQYWMTGNGGYAFAVTVMFSVLSIIGIFFGTMYAILETDFKEKVNDWFWGEQE